MALLNEHLATAATAGDAQRVAMRQRINEEAEILEERVRRVVEEGERMVLGCRQVMARMKRKQTVEGVDDRQIARLNERLATSMAERVAMEQQIRRNQWFVNGNLTWTRSRSGESLAGALRCDLTFNDCETILAGRFSVCLRDLTALSNKGRMRIGMRRGSCLWHVLGHSRIPLQPLPTTDRQSRVNDQCKGIWERLRSPAVDGPTIYHPSHYCLPLLQATKSVSLVAGSE